jgi:ankyrin repeat protein
MLGVLEYAEVGCFDTVRNILDTDPFSIDDRDYVGCSALHKAAYNGFPRIVDLLLDYGAPVDSRDMDMFTPLHLACMSGSLASGEIIHILADRGADLSAQDKVHSRIQV